MRLPAGALILLAVLGSGCGERVESRYATLDEAVEAGAVGTLRWIPDFLPASATEIREIHDLDTNEGWLRFRYSGEDHAAMVARLEPGSSTELRAAGLGDPGVEWWNRDDLMALAENSVVYLHVEQTENEAGTVFTSRRMVVLSPERGQGFVWLYAASGTPADAEQAVGAR